MWIERFFGLMPASRAPLARRRARHLRTVGGYVTGNLLISLIAGALTTLVLLVMGVPYAVALGLIVAILDLIPLAGATIAAVIIGIVAFLHSIPAGIVVVVFFILYQQLENHVLQPRRLQPHRPALAARDPHVGAARSRDRRDPRRPGGDPGRRSDPGAARRLPPRPARGRDRRALIT